VLYLNTEITYMKNFRTVNLPQDVMCDITTVYIWVLKILSSDCISCKKLKLIISHGDTTSSSYA